MLTIVSSKQYDSAFEGFKTFCLERQGDPLNASVTDCLEFFALLSENVRVSRIYIYLSAISHHYRRLGLVSPCDDVRIRMFMKGLRRTNSSVNMGATYS